MPSNDFSCKLFCLLLKINRRPTTSSSYSQSTTPLDTFFRPPPRLPKLPQHQHYLKASKPPGDTQEERWRKEKKRGNWSRQGTGLQFQFLQMGKIKSKYPLEIELDFMLFLQSSDLIRESYSCVLDKGNLEYWHLEEAFEEFLGAHEINYEAYMFFQSVQSDKEELVQTDWSLTLPQLEQHHRYIIIKVKSHTQHMKDLFYEQIEDVLARIQKIQEQLHRQPRIQEEQRPENKITIPVPMLHHASSITQPILMDKDLDIGVLFSEPIFDEKKQKEANMPVDFRSELQRLESALNNSYKPEITIECEIATKEHLKHLITYKRPKVLHIICHGSKDGELEFQDDSKFAVGTLCSISTEKIKEILKGRKEFMPELVFINSCHSQIIGRVFFEAGAKYCIMIDSQDKIDDEAAQIFSENFYRNVFRGQKVGLAFKEAQDNVKIKHNSSGCCCRHTSREVHKKDCRWLELCQTMGEQEAHKNYHIPSNKCTCQLRNLNQHELTCEWAQFSLFHINNDFRIMDNGIQRFPKKKSELPKYLPSDQKKPKLLICCCFNLFDGTTNKENKFPHSESNKFKMLPEDIENTDAIYELTKNIAFRTQVISMTAPELIEHHERVQNSSVMGRQQELFDFMKNLQNNQYNTFFVYGHPGVGKTTFAIKAATYLLERQIFYIYYFVDLFGIKDRDMFRNKFNQVTSLDFPYNHSIIKEISGRKMIIILDNVDEFFISSIQEFQDQLASLKNEFPHLKIILTCKEKNISVLDSQSFYTDSHCLRRQVSPLDDNTAAKALFSKIRSYLDISISYLDIREIVASKPQLRIPKMIENLSHSFSHSKGKVKLKDLQEKIKQLGQGDLAFNKLIEENINLLKYKCKESYDMLIFISQFSQGIDKNDFNILSSYDRSDNRQGLESAMIDIPIDRNWKKRLAVLFEKPQNSDLGKLDSQTETLTSENLTMDRKTTQFNPEPAISSIIPDEVFQSDSYFLEELSRNRFVVRRFIRDFIWNKDKSDENFYMKHIFVAYTAVMLDIYLSFLVQEQYIHESLIEYSDISQAGIFKYKDNNYFQINLTESIRYVEDYNSRFEKILKQQHALKEKIKNSDPSVFILNHKLDFLHIYGYDWSKIYEYLYHTRKKEASVLINYLQRLIILIPTAMKVANLEQSLRKYAIRQSIQLLAQIRKYSKPAHNLMLTLKLKLMRASEEVQKNQQNLLPTIEFQKDFHMTDLQGIDTGILKSTQAQFNSEIEVLQIYQEYVRAKEYSKNSEISLKNSQKVVETIRKLAQWTDHHFREGFDCDVLDAKRKTILSLIFLKILEVSLKYPTNTKIQQYRNNNSNLTSFFKRALQAAAVFQAHHMTKLTLRAKLVALSINWEQIKTRIKQYQFSRQVERQRDLLKECQELYEDKRNNLIGLTIFDAVLKKIKKEMKERMWQESVNNIVMLKAVPLSNKNTPILQNVVRRRQKYRKNLEQIFRHAKIDISVKFQILTAERLEQQTKRNSNILILITSFRTQGGKTFIVCQNPDLTQRYIEINAEFIKKFKLQNTKLIIMMGSNATDAFEKLIKLLPTSPSILSVDTGSTAEFDDFDDLNYQGVFDNNVSQELRKTIQHNKKIDNGKIKFVENFLQSLINPKNVQNLNNILEDLRVSCSEILMELKVKKRQCQKEFIRLSQGTFKDLSPGFRKAHNVDLDFQIKNNTTPCVYRKWKEINQLFKEFGSKKETKYIQICGGNGVGKTTFIHEVGRMCIERGLFENGVYIIDGKKVGENFQSDFEAYITKMSENSGMFTLSSFNKYADSNFLLIIDDFHTIRPRSNGRYNLFMTKLLQKKASVIFVTHETYNMRDLVSNIKQIKLQKLTDIELNIFAYNLFKSKMEQGIEEYEQQKKHHHLTCAQIANIYEKNLPSKNYNNMMMDLPEDMRKLTSNMT